MKEVILKPNIEKVGREVGVGDILEAKVKLLVTDEFTAKGGHIKVTMGIFTENSHTEFTDEFIRRNVRLVVEKDIDVI